MLLGFMLLASAGSAQVVGCVAEGPDLQATVSYITAKAKLADHHFEIRTDVEHGTLDLYTSETQRYRIQFANLACSRTAFGMSPENENSAQIFCNSSMKCVQRVMTWPNDPNTFRPTSEIRNREWFTTESGDPDGSRNLARALSHLIYLLQQSFQKQNTGNDPFAPK